MRKISTPMTMIVLLAAAAGLSGTARAAEPPAAAAPSPFGAAPTVDAEQLRAVTGQADLVQEVRAQNTANVSHNSVNGQSQTGTISFDAASFQNMNGLSVLSANTGNNVAINSSLNVNVAIRP
jgi:hypothetical protein